MSRRQNTETDFWNRVDKNGPNGCWIYKGFQRSDGYGEFTFQKKLWLSHRIAYLFRYGSIDPEAFICHHCDNHICVNPEHLFSGTPADNMRDMRDKGRNRKAKGEESGAAKLSQSDIEFIRNSGIDAKELCIRFGVSRQHIYSIRNRKVWKHI